MTPSPPAPTEPLSPYDEPMPLREIMFSFKGRVPRKVYWLYGVVGLLLASVMVTLLLGIAGFDELTADLVANLLIAWPAAAITVKRWHDRDKSGWWLLINLVPFVGVVWSLIENGLLRGTVGANRFGADLTGQL